jgi:Zn-dependent metalloprotease
MEGSTWGYTIEGTMITKVVLVALLGTSPVQDFAERNPASSRIPAADGRSLLHASGFRVATGARLPEEAARTFLAADGAAFGVAADQELVLVSSPLQGEVGAVRFRRSVGGLPVFGGDLVVGVDGTGSVFLVNTSAAGPGTAGHHLFSDGEAARLAAASFQGGLRGDGPATVTRGWRQVEGTLRAVYRVDVVASEPRGEWRVFLDGETGRTVFRHDRRVFATAPASVYELSPTETAAALCPVSGSGGRTFCASPVTVTLPNLTTGLDLTGSQATVYNCRGGPAPAVLADVPGACVAVSAVSNAFQFPPDTTWVSPTDDFAAVMAYYHLDRHATFFRSLDPRHPTGGNRALSASLPALVNVYKDGAPFENAFYSSALDAMVFGQGAAADYAYDGTIMYHEFTHAVVSAWGDFAIDIDSRGAFEEPGAVNEGTADAMASSLTGHGQMASFVGTTDTPPAPYLRDMDDPTASRTCQGDGTPVRQLEVSGVINGMDGEVHDDGEIWNGFFWEVFQGLRAADVKGCDGACDAAPAIQYKAIQLAGGTSPSLSRYWQTFRAAAEALFPTRPEVAAYVTCVAARRRFEGCDRTVPVYAGEKKVQYIRLSVSSYQFVVPVTAAGAQVQVCNLKGTTGTLYAKRGSTVGVTPGSFPASVVDYDLSVPVGSTCNAQGTSWDTLTLDAVGTWYLLLRDPMAAVGETPGRDRFTFQALPAGVATRPALPPPGTCAVGEASLAILPATARAPPRGAVSFTASGGSGSGHAWSLATNASGGTIDAATGAYVAGATANVTDVVAVTDSAGGQATRNVTVTAGVTVTPVAPSVAAGGTLALVAAGGSGTGFAWSLTASPSGGTIHPATGVYTAGATGGVSDVVRVVDSLSNAATVNVSVTGSSGGGGGGKGCSSSGGAEWASLVAGLAWLLRRRPASASRRREPMA